MPSDGDGLLSEHRSQRCSQRLVLSHGKREHLHSSGWAPTLERRQRLVSSAAESHRAHHLFKLGGEGGRSAAGVAGHHRFQGQACFHTHDQLAEGITEFSIHSLGQSLALSTGQDQWHLPGACADDCAGQKIDRRWRPH